MPSSANENNEYIKGNLRNLGLYIAGVPGRGKTTLLQNLVIDDIRDGSGVCLIDPGGDLINDLIHHLPDSRVQDTILFETRNPIPIDFFSYKDPEERTLLVDMLMGIFDLTNAPVAKPRLERIINTIFDANDYLDKHEPDNVDARCTFLDIREFIENPVRQKEIFRYAPEREPGWKAQGLKPADFNPIWERMSHFFENPALKTIFGSKRPRLRIADVMEKNQVLLVNLRQTKSDSDIAALIAAKFHQATFARRDILRKSEREPYYLYIDECHKVLKFAKADFDDFLTGVRKFNLCLTLANQFPSDLPGTIESNIRAMQTAILFKLPPDQVGPFKLAFPRPVPKPDRTRERGRLVDEYNDVREKIEEFKSLKPTSSSQGPRYTESEARALTNHADRLYERRDKIKKQLMRLDEDVAGAQTVPDYIDILANLPVGQAVCVPEQGEPFLIETPEPLEEHDPYDGCAEYLRKSTKDNFACNRAGESLDTTSTRRAANPDEDDKSERSPSISSIASKKKDSRSAG